MPTGHKKVGPIVTVAVVVLLLIVAALYLFASKINRNTVPVDSTVATNDTSDEAQTVQPVTNKSNDIQSIEADLNASTQGLDAQNF